MPKTLRKKNLSYIAARVCVTLFALIVGNVPSEAFMANMTFWKKQSVGLQILSSADPLWGAVDGPPGVATFTNQTVMAADVAGNIYMGSGWSVLRKITQAGITTTVAGVANSYGYVDGVGTAARFNVINGLAISSAGDIYVADSTNNRIRKVTPAGVVSTYAGSGAVGSADGPLLSAEFNQPAGLAFDAAGNLFVGDSENNTIRKITTATGIVSTYVGTAGPFFTSAGSGNDGVGPLATFWKPWSLAFDSSGNLFVFDENNKKIRKITPGLVVTTLAGQHCMMGYDDGVGAAAQFGSQGQLLIDSNDIMWFMDGYNMIVRRITPAGAVTTVVGQHGQTPTAYGVPLPAKIWMAQAGVIWGGKIFFSDIYGIGWFTKPP